MPFILFLLQSGHLPDVTDLGRPYMSELRVALLVLQCMYWYFLQQHVTHFSADILGSMLSTSSEEAIL